jgi:GNAT superfamily N-acetyltransferase
VRSELIISLEDEALPEDLEAVHAGLRRFNRTHAGDPNYATMHLFLRTPDGQVVGGCLGETAWQWLFVSTLWVADELRGRGYGRRLLEAAEQEARQRGCREVYLDTYEFQAKLFYERLGYSVFGVQEGYPPGFNRYYLRKSLSSEPPCYA